MKRVNLLDATWLAMESDQTPMHVGGLQIFRLPQGAPKTFLRDLFEELKQHPVGASPWNLKLSHASFIGRLLTPEWVVDEDIDIDHHVRHSALPYPGGERQLGSLVSRLHSTELDLQRPLWEWHLIEGLENRRFAMYTKIHHSLVDGVGGMRMLQRILSPDPNKRGMSPPWVVGPRKRHKKPSALSPEGIRERLRSTTEQIKGTAEAVQNLSSAVYRLIDSGLHHGNLVTPFQGPNSVLNKRISHQRRVATNQYSIRRLKTLARKTDATLNDIVLYLCGSALRSYMQEHHALEKQALTAGIPVNIRARDDDGIGTSLGILIASLGTSHADPIERLEAIKASTRSAKDQLQQMPRSAIANYTVMIMSPYILEILFGLGGRVRPGFNLIISNVPGPEEAQYFNGAKMVDMYPLSIVVQGSALNITCVSYDGKLNFSYLGCRKSLPKMQKLAFYSDEALKALEERLK